MVNRAETGNQLTMKGYKISSNGSVKSLLGFKAEKYEGPLVKTGHMISCTKSPKNFCFSHLCLAATGLLTQWNRTKAKSQCSHMWEHLKFILLFITVITLFIISEVVSCLNSYKVPISLNGDMMNTSICWMFNHLLTATSGTFFSCWQHTANTQQSSVKKCYRRELQIITSTTLFNCPPFRTLD